MLLEHPNTLRIVDERLLSDPKELLRNVLRANSAWIALFVEMNSIRNSNSEFNFKFETHTSDS